MSFVNKIKGWGQKSPAPEHEAPEHDAFRVDQDPALRPAPHAGVQFVAAGLAVAGDLRRQTDLFHRHAGLHL